MAKHRVIEDPDLLEPPRTKSVPDVVVLDVLLAAAPGALRDGR